MYAALVFCHNPCRKCSAPWYWNAAGKARRSERSKASLTRQESNAEALLHRAEAEAVRDPLAGVDFGELELSLYRPRDIFQHPASWVVGGMTLFALIPLFAVLWMLIWRGGQKLSLALFNAAAAPLEQGGFRKRMLAPSSWSVSPL